MRSNIIRDYDERESDLEFFLEEQKVQDWTGTKFKFKSKAYKVLKEMININYEKVFVVPNQQSFDTNGFNKSYDVVATNFNGRVLETFENVEPDNKVDGIDDGWFLCFFPTGSIKYFSIVKGNRIQFKRNKKRISALNLF